MKRFAFGVNIKLCTTDETQFWKTSVGLCYSVGRGCIGDYLRYGAVADRACPVGWRSRVAAGRRKNYLITVVFAAFLSVKKMHIESGIESQMRRCAAGINLNFGTSDVTLFGKTLLVAATRAAAAISQTASIVAVQEHSVMVVEEKVKSVLYLEQAGQIARNTNHLLLYTPAPVRTWPVARSRYCRGPRSRSCLCSYCRVGRPFGDGGRNGGEREGGGGWYREAEGKSW